MKNTWLMLAIALLLVSLENIAHPQVPEVKPRNTFPFDMKRVSVAQPYLDATKQTLFLFANDRINSKIVSSYFDTKTGEKKKDVQLKGFIEIDFSRDFLHYASRHGLTAVGVRRVVDNEVLLTFDIGRDFSVLDMCVVHNGQRLIVCGYDQIARKGQLRIIEVSSGKVIVDHHYEKPYGAAKVYADEKGERICVATGEGTLVYGLSDSFDKPILLDSERTDTEVVMSRDGQYLLLGQGQTEVWRLSSNEPPKLLTTLKRDGYTPAISLVPGTELVAKAQQLDPYVAIRKLDDGSEVARLVGEGDAGKNIVGLGFTPDGAMAIGVAQEGHVLIWDTKSLVEKFARSGGNGNAEFAMRRWTSASGDRTIQAQLVQFADGKVTLKRDDGRTFVVELSVFSEQDQQYVRDSVGE